MRLPNLATFTLYKEKSLKLNATPPTPRPQVMPGSLFQGARWWLPWQPGLVLERSGIRHLALAPCVRIPGLGQFLRSSEICHLSVTHLTATCTRSIWDKRLNGQTECQLGGTQVDGRADERRVPKKNKLAAECLCGCGSIVLVTPASQAPF